jgi:hypothetical protein
MTYKVLRLGISWRCETLKHALSRVVILTKHVFNIGREMPIIVQGTCSDTI